MNWTDTASLFFVALSAGFIRIWHLTIHNKTSPLCSFRGWKADLQRPEAPPKPLVIVPSLSVTTSWNSSSLMEAFVISTTKHLPLGIFRNKNLSAQPTHPHPPKKIRVVVEGWRIGPPWVALLQDFVGRPCAPGPPRGKTSTTAASLDRPFVFLKGYVSTRKVSCIKTLE